jgi:capsular polysaccharide biosynthesis protein
LTQESIINLKNLILTLRKHILPILLVTLFLGFMGFFISTVIIKPMYGASAQLIVSVPLSKDGTVTQGDLQISQQLVNSYTIILKGNTILSNVRNNLGLDESASQLSREVSVKGVGTTQIINLSVQNANPAVAAEIANEIIRLAPDEIARTVNIGTVAVVSPVASSSTPDSPNVVLITLAAAAAGLLVSCFAVVLIDMLNDRFRSVSDIQEKLGFPVIGIIPNVGVSGGRGGFRHLRGLFSGQRSGYYYY